MEHVWYAAYGSNLDPERFRCYLEGGRPAGARRELPGARDRSPPREVRAVELRGEVYFAWESPTWGGGIAFYDTGAEAASAGVAYRLTASQLSDVLAQEMHRDPGADLDLTELVDTGRAVLGPGRYEALHVVDRLDGVPVVTFTASWEAREIAYNAPAAAYLATMGRGLRDVHGWDPAQTAAYLLDRPGLGPDWDAAALLRVLTP